MVVAVSVGEVVLGVDDEARRDDRAATACGEQAMEKTRAIVHAETAMMSPPRRTVHPEIEKSRWGRGNFRFRIFLPLMI